MIISILSSALGFFLGARFLPGVKPHNFLTGIVVALVVALLSVTLGTLLKILSLGILTLGIFTLLLNAILIQVADWFLKDFDVKNFWWALALALVVAVVNIVVGKIV